MPRYAEGSLPGAALAGACIAVIALVLTLELPLLGGVAAGLLAGTVCGFVSRGGAWHGARAGLMAGLASTAALAVLRLSGLEGPAAAGEAVPAFQGAFLVATLVASAAIASHVARGAPLPEPATFALLPPADYPPGRLAAVPPSAPPVEQPASGTPGAREKRITCPDCSRGFDVRYASLPLPVECPECGKRGVLR